MHSGRQARKAQEAATAAADEARATRAEIQKKEAAEKEKIQRKLIRQIKGRFNPFEFLPDSNTLGGNTSQQANNQGGGL